MARTKPFSEKKPAKPAAVNAAKEKLALVTLIHHELVKLDARQLHILFTEMTRPFPMSATLPTAPVYPPRDDNQCIADTKNWKWPATDAAPAPAKPSAAPDVADLLDDDGRALIQSHRDEIAPRFYHGHEFVMLKVCTYGQDGGSSFKLAELPQDVLAVTAISTEPFALERAVREVFNLARTLDSGATAHDDRFRR